MVMREITMKKLVATLVVLVVVGFQAPSATGGGNWLEFRSAESDRRLGHSAGHLRRR